MAERIYLGPVSKQLRGDHEDALTLERTARAKVGYLFDSMAPGQTFKSGSWSLGDGRRILAFVWNDTTGKRAVVRLTGVGGKEGLYTTYNMETGWLTFNDLLDGENAERDGLPFIYTWDFYGDSYIEFFPSITKLDVMGPGSFTKYPQEIIGNSYESRDEERKDLPQDGGFYLAGNQDRPELFSGLTRLLVQALVGAGRSILDLIPESWIVDLQDIQDLHHRLGCIRYAPGRYALVIVRGTGVQAVRLDVDPALATIPLADLTEDDRLMAEAWLLSTATSAGESQDLRVTGAELLPEIYPDPPDENVHMQGWGWCWRFQRIDAIDSNMCGAATVVHTVSTNSTGYTDARGYDVVYAEYALDITVADGELHVKLEKTKVGPTAKCNAYRLGRSQALVLMSGNCGPPAETGDTTTYHRLAVVYRPDGELGVFGRRSIDPDIDPDNYSIVDAYDMGGTKVGYGTRIIGTPAYSCVLTPGEPIEANEWEQKFISIQAERVDASQFEDGDSIIHVHMGSAPGVFWYTSRKSMLRSSGSRTLYDDSPIPASDDSLMSRDQFCAILFDSYCDGGACEIDGTYIKEVERLGTSGAFDTFKVDVATPGLDPDHPDDPCNELYLRLFGYTGTSGIEGYRVPYSILNYRDPDQSGPKSVISYGERLQVLGAEPPDEFAPGEDDLGRWIGGA